MNTLKEIEEHFTSELTEEIKFREKLMIALEQIPSQIAKYWNCDKKLISINDIQYSKHSPSKYNASVCFDIYTKYYANENPKPILKYEFHFNGVYRPEPSIEFEGKQYDFKELNPFFDYFHKKLLSLDYSKLIEYNS